MEITIYRRHSADCPQKADRYQSQLMSPSPCWTFVSVLERRMRELEEQAR